MKTRRSDADRYHEEEDFGCMPKGLRMDRLRSDLIRRGDTTLIRRTTDRRRDRLHADSPTRIRRPWQYRRLHERSFGCTLACQGLKESIGSMPMKTKQRRRIRLHAACRRRHGSPWNTMNSEASKLRIAHQPTESWDAVKRTNTHSKFAGVKRHECLQGP
mgnify:CR=1 FL=1